MSSMFKEMKFEQPKSFSFTKENLAKAQSIIAKYPKGSQQSAVMPLLYIAQSQNKNWIPFAAMECIAELLDMPVMKVYEVASFYTMYNKQPVGEHLIQVCRTTPCWLRGSDEITEVCKQKLNIEVGETTKDNKFTLVEVECLGGCANAPVVQINFDYYEDLNGQSMSELLDNLAAGKKVQSGSRLGRISSEPQGYTPMVAAPTLVTKKVTIKSKVSKKDSTKAQKTTKSVKIKSKK
jgi:NADH-quinone oxidoreductase E subunit